MGYIQIILLALEVARGFIKYLNTQAETKKDKLALAKDFSSVVKRARKEGDTYELEKIFGKRSGDVSGHDVSDSNGGVQNGKNSGS